MLTNEEKESLDLSPERIEGLAVAEGPERKSAIRNILRRFTENLKEEARLIEDAGKRDLMLSKVTEKGKAARKHIIDELKTKSAKKLRVSQKNKTQVMEPLLSLNLYNKGQRITSTELLNQELPGTIDVRSPKKEVMEYLDTLLSPTSTIGPNLRKNAEKIKSVLEDRLKISDYREFKIDINQYLGAVDVSKKNVRIKVYNYWAKIGGLYEQFEEDMANFFIEVRDIEWNPETKEKFDDLSRRFNDTNLEYIAKFKNIERGFESGYNRFFNAVSYKLAIDRMTSKEEGSANYKDEKDFADVSQQLLEEMTSSLSSGSDTTGTVNLEELGEEYTWQDERDNILQYTDPLLVYEYNRGEKLISVTETMEKEILDVLEDMLDALDDGEGVTLETTRDVEEWLEQVEDTQILDEGEVETMALPISVMNNANFNKMYSENEFPSFTEDENINVDSIDNIKNFFNDLYEILSAEDFRAEVETRSSKGRGRGSNFEYREAQGTKVGLIGGAKVPLSLNQKGELRGELEAFKGDLQKMMDSAIAYFFDPMYSGMLPIEMPRFASSIGSKVIQTLSLDLGLETVMSGAYDTLFEGSRQEIDVGDLNAIADFLNSIFMPEVNINTELITDGEEFADALTEIFGSRTEEKNYNYAAALIHHYMKETGKLEKEEEDFEGKTIKERAELFYKDFKARKPFPVFALPHWLDMNQGILTKDSPAKKRAYNSLKSIFESAQIDLPVLLHKLLKAHDAIRQQLGKPIIYSQIPLNDYGINKMITNLQVEENIDLTSFEVEQIIKAEDSHQNISNEYGISTEHVYMIKASFR